LRQLAGAKLMRVGRDVGCNCANTLPGWGQWLIAVGDEGAKGAAGNAQPGLLPPGCTDPSPLPIELFQQPNFAQGRAPMLIVSGAPKDCHTGEAMRLDVFEPGLRLGPVEVHK
jgi:hypothetical protein